MFRTTFDDVVKDFSALYNLLTRHVTGPAKQAIVPCVYSAIEVNRYEEAVKILEARYGYAKLCDKHTQENFNEW